MFTEPMLRFFAIVMERDGEKVSETLLGTGTVQFISIDALDTKAIDLYHDNAASLTTTSTRLAELRKRIENFLDSAAIVPRIPSTTDPAKIGSCDIPKENRFIDSLAASLQEIREKQRLLQNEILRYEEIKHHIDRYGSDNYSTTIDRNYSYISLKQGMLPSDAEPLLKTQIHTIPLVPVLLGEKDGYRHMLLVFMKRDSSRIESVLSTLGWQDRETGSAYATSNNDTIAAIDEKLDTLRGQQREFQHAGQAVITDRKDILLDTWVRIRVNELLLNVRSAFNRSDRTILFSGWLPSAQRRLIYDSLQKVTAGRCHIEWFAPGAISDLLEEPVKVPVKLNNPKFLAPFQMLVTNFGIPEYGTIDPTPFLVITYLTMFGLMFADIGHGLMVALAGIAGGMLLKDKPTYRKLSALLVWCGGASIITGFLFGSFFGYNIIKPLWFDFHGVVTNNAHSSSKIASIFDILGITVRFGITVISCGLLFNWINLIRKREWFELVFEKGGFLGGWMYWGGIYCGWYMVGHGYNELPSPGTLVVLVVVPAVCLFFKGPIHIIKHHSRFTITSVIQMVMEWVVELLEIFSGYLSNTLSFMRVAGLGIAHVSLMASFFTMAAMMKGDNPSTLQSIGAVLLIIAGNALVIGLEGLSAGIQALRLNYYEFFTKFFLGTGKLFNPVSLRDNII